MRAFLGLILTFILSMPVWGQNRQPTTPPSGQQQPATPFSMPGIPYDPRTDPRLTDPSYVPRVFQLHYVDARWIEQLLFPYGAMVQRQDNLNSIAVRAPSAVIDKVEALIKQMDVPANATKTVSVTCYLILASPTPNASEAMPPALKPVVDQLRNLLAYKSYGVIDTIFGATTEGRQLQLSGAAAKTSDTAPWISNYVLYATPGVSGEGGNVTIRLENVKFSAELQTANLGLTPGGQNVHVGIDTSLDVKPGQQVVVGKSTVRDHALILVVSAKVD
jgi:hypothetical protein